MIALGYVRRSKKKSKLKSDSGVVSLEMQHEAIADYCKKLGWALGAVLSHNGVSGTKRERFDAIEQQSQAIGAGAIVVYNLDRLARDSAGLLDYLKSVTKRGIQVHESTGGLVDFSKSLGRLVVSVRGAMDEFYASVVGEKTTDALRFKREAGLRYTNIAPFGFRYEEGAMLPDDAEQKAIVVINHCADLGLGRCRTLKVLRETYSGRGGLSTVQRLINLRKEQFRLAQLGKG